MLRVILVVLVLVKTRWTIPAPHPTDCIQADIYDPPTYCGVKVFCRCVKVKQEFGPQKESNVLESCYSLPNPKSGYSPGGSLIKALPIYVRASSKSGEEALRDLEVGEVTGEIFTPETSRGGKQDLYIPGHDILVPKNDARPFLEPEHLDAGGCGVHFGNKTKEGTTLRLVDMGNLGRQYLPGNVIQILKLIDKRTNGKCKFVNEQPTANVCFMSNSTLMSMVVEIKKPRLRQTVINTIHQKYKEDWIKNSRGETFTDVCYSLAKVPNQILCLIERKHR